MKTEQKTEIDVKPRPLAGYGRDELNIAEFPITLLTDEVPEGVKTVSFSDQITDQGTGETITRTVTITGSDKYGLPTPTDMDILLCLIQLTKAENDFTNPEVPFRRGDVLKLMGLADTGRNYSRLDEAMRCWLGVTLYYDSSWWDKETKKWTTPEPEGFHIFEHILLLNRESKRRRKANSQIELFESSFTWNKIFFKSCQAENLKYLDMETYFSLKRAVTKQMYRFLDKRFYRGRHWTFNLRQFAFEHVGLSRNYDTGKIKERLQHALDELEAIGFLEPCSKEERYQKEGKEWKIHLTAKSPVPALEARQESQPEHPALYAELIRIGVAAYSAADLVRRFPDRIPLQIEYLEWEVANKPAKIKDPAAYLVKAIERNNTAPKRFVSKEQRQHQADAKRESDLKAADDLRQKREAEAKEQRIEQQTKAHLKSRTPEQLAQLEADAIAQASEDTRFSLDEPHMKQFRKTQITMLVREHVARMIEAGQLVVEPA